MKKSNSDWLNSGNALIGLQHLSENAIFVFSVVPGCAKAQVILGDILKCLLIVYPMRNISAKKYQNRFTCQKYSKPKCGTF